MVRIPRRVYSFSIPNREGQMDAVWISCSSRRAGSIVIDGKGKGMGGDRSMGSISGIGVSWSTIDRCRCRGSWSEGITSTHTLFENDFRRKAMWSFDIIEGRDLKPWNRVPSTSPAPRVDLPLGEAEDEWAIRLLALPWLICLKTPTPVENERLTLPPLT